MVFIGTESKWSHGFRCVHSFVIFDSLGLIYILTLYCSYGNGGCQGGIYDFYFMGNFIGRYDNIALYGLKGQWAELPYYYYSSSSSFPFSSSYSYSSFSPFLRIPFQVPDGVDQLTFSVTHLNNPGGRACDYPFSLSALRIHMGRQRFPIKLNIHLFLILQLLIRGCSWKRHVGPHWRHGLMATSGLGEFHLDLCHQRGQQVSNTPTILFNTSHHCPTTLCLLCCYYVTSVVVVVVSYLQQTDGLLWSQDYGSRFPPHRSFGGDFLFYHLELNYFIVILFLGDLEITYGTSGITCGSDYGYSFLDISSL